MVLLICACPFVCYSRVATIFSFKWNKDLRKGGRMNKWVDGGRDGWTDE